MAICVMAVIGTARSLKRTSRLSTKNSCSQGLPPLGFLLYRAVFPPSTTRAWPTTKLASGLHSQRTAATSETIADSANLKRGRVAPFFAEAKSKSPFYWKEALSAKAGPAA
jgi:hypothetical protein